MQKASSQLAMLGGTPVRTQPFSSWPIWGKEEEDAVVRVVQSGKWGRFNGGTQVETFERRFAEYQGAKYGIAIVNGSVTLRIALIACGIEAGDEVIVPPYTFLATATAVLEANAVPRFVDIDPDTFNIDPKCIEAAITPRTRAIIPVHLGGQAADMEAIMAIAKKHGLHVIEDAAHAHGGEYKGKRLGSIGHLGSFSFQSSKNLNCGEGGILITNDELLAEICRSIHNCGRRSGGAWYEHAVLGGNYRLSEFQGAILNCQLDRFDAQAETRDANGRFLVEQLGKIPGIRPQARGRGETRHGYHLFPLRYDPAVYGVPRTVFVKALQAEGIPANEGYTVPLYEQPLFTQKAFGPFTGYRLSQPNLDYTKVVCPQCDRLCKQEGMWLSQAVLLGSKTDMEQIVQAFQKLYDRREELVMVKGE